MVSGNINNKQLQGINWIFWLPPQQRVEMLVIESCCARWVQAQSQMDQLGGKPLPRCQYLARNPAPALMSFIIVLFSNKIIKPFMMDYLNGPSLVLLVFLTSVSEEKCYVTWLIMATLFSCLIEIKWRSLKDPTRWRS